MIFGNQVTSITTTSETSVYNPTEAVGTVIGFTITNTDTADASVDVKINTVYLVKGLAIATGATVSLPDAGQRIVVKHNDTATDALSVTSSKTVDVIVSYME